MKILISGASGFIGKNLTKFLLDKNHQIQFLTRDPNLSENKNIQFWDPDNSKLDKDLVEKSDIVISLNGKNIISPFRNKLREIKSSRYNPVETFISTFGKCTKLPKLFISASACGFYGDRPNEILDEYSPKGYGILPEISNEWEKLFDNYMGNIHEKQIISSKEIRNRQNNFFIINRLYLSKIKKKITRNE